MDAFICETNFKSEALGFDRARASLIGSAKYLSEARPKSIRRSPEENNTKYYCPGPDRACIHAVVSIRDYSCSGPAQKKINKI